MNGPGWSKLVQYNFVAVCRACVAIFRPIESFKGRTFVRSGFSLEGTLIFVVHSNTTAGVASGPPDTNVVSAIVV